MKITTWIVRKILKGRFGGRFIESLDIELRVYVREKEYMRRKLTREDIPLITDSLQEQL